MSLYGCSFARVKISHMVIPNAHTEFFCCFFCPTLTTWPLSLSLMAHGYCYLLMTFCFINQYLMIRILSISRHADVDLVTNWAKLNHLELNSRKSKLMFITRSHVSQCPSILLHGVRLDQVHHYKCLGV